MTSDSETDGTEDSDPQAEDGAATDIEELIAKVIELEQDLDRSLGRVTADEEIEERFKLLDALVVATSNGLSSLQSEYPIRYTPHLIRSILDVEGRRERAAARHNDLVEELRSERAAGQLSEWQQRMLERWEREGPTDFIPSVMPPEREILRRKLVLHLAWERVQGLPEVAAKAIELMPFVLRARLPDAVAQYLARVAANFIEGRHVEGVILSRAVLDAAMKERVPDAEVLRWSTKLKRESEVTLLHRISAANRLGRLSKASADLAHLIRVRGNDAVHVNASTPEGFVGNFDYVRALAAVLEEVYAPTSTS